MHSQAHVFQEGTLAYLLLHFQNVRQCSSYKNNCVKGKKALQYKIHERLERNLLCLFWFYIIFKAKGLLVSVVNRASFLQTAQLDGLVE